MRSLQFAFCFQPTFESPLKGQCSSQADDAVKNVVTSSRPHLVWGYRFSGWDRVVAVAVEMKKQGIEFCVPKHFRRIMGGNATCNESDLTQGREVLFVAETWMLSEIPLATTVTRIDDQFSLIRLGPNQSVLELEAEIGSLTKRNRKARSRTNVPI